MTDAEREDEISKANERIQHALKARQLELEAVHMKRFNALVNGRSPSQVARMEAEKGLCVPR